METDRCAYNELYIHNFCLFMENAVTARKTRSDEEFTRRILPREEDAACNNVYVPSRVQRMERISNGKKSSFAINWNSAAFFFLLLPSARWKWNTRLDSDTSKKRRDTRKPTEITISEEGCETVESTKRSKRMPRKLLSNFFQGKSFPTI